MPIGRPKKYKTKMFRKPQLLNESEVEVLKTLSKQQDIAEQRVLGCLISQYLKGNITEPKKTQSDLLLKSLKRIPTNIGLDVSDK